MLVYSYLTNNVLLGKRGEVVTTINDHNGTREEAVILLQEATKAETDTRVRAWVYLDGIPHYGIEILFNYQSRLFEVISEKQDGFKGNETTAVKAIELAEKILKDDL